MSDVKISNDEQAYMTECRQAVERAMIVRDHYASYLLKKYGIVKGRIKTDGTIEDVSTPQVVIERE